MSGMKQDARSAKKGDELSFFIVRKEQIPVIHFRIAVRFGAADDPPEREGVGSFTAQLMKRGTASYSRQEIEDTLDFIASDLWVSCKKDMTVFGGRTLASNIEAFYGILSEVLLKPTFPEEEIEKLRIDQIDEIESIRESDEALVREAFQNFIYEGHPYSHLNVGTISSIRRFTRQHIMECYARNFFRGNIMIGLAGAVPESLVERMRADFSSLPAGSITKKLVRAEVPARKRVLVLEKEGRTQTQLKIGHPISLTRKDDDYFPLLIANNYLGKHRVSIGRLYNEIRERRGLSYGAYSYIEHFLGMAGAIKLSVPNLARREQYFSIWVYPKSENAKFVIKLSLKELSDLVEKGIENNQLHEVKNFTKNNFPFEVETPDRKLAMMLDDALYGSNRFAERFERNVENVTSDHLHRTVKEHLFPERVAIAVVVSDAEKFINEMLSSETKIEYPSGVDPRSLEDEDTAIKSFDLGLQRGDFTTVKVSDLFQ